MTSTLASDHKTFRIAGILYIILIGIASYGMGYVPSRIMVSQNPVETINNMLSNEFLFRTGIASHLISTTIIVVVALLLYSFFKKVNENLSRFMITPIVLQVPIVLILECFNVAALMIAKGETWITLDMGKRQELSFLMLRIHGFGIGVSQLFWGLWLVPFGILVFQSRFISRIFGVLLVLNGIGYIVEAFAYVLLQRSDYLMVRQFDRLTFIGLPLTMLWFLYIGFSKKDNRIT